MDLSGTSTEVTDETKDTARKAENWNPTSWQEFQVKQMPEYPDQELLNKSFRELKHYPPLVTSWEIEKLRLKLAEAGDGKRFIMQGGDCAETFDGCNPTNIVNLLKVLLQTSFILIHEMGIPVTRIGRIAGQYAKPRSNPYEEVNGEKMLTYRGDLFNSIEPNSEARQPDPRRLVEGYQKSSMTLNFIRALIEEGFADLHHPEYWELDFMKQNKYYKEYEAMVRSINKAIRFVESVSSSPFPALQNVRMYTSHEALNLYYEAAQTRRVPRRSGWYNLSAHMVWLGNRTRELDGAHVEYLRGIVNPVGIKVGPKFDPDATVQLIKKLNPNNEKGKIVLITRMGADNIQEKLPKLINVVRDNGLNVVWLSDPMHGNTFSTEQEVKTRNFDKILEEARQAFIVHRKENNILGGIHLELTGSNVTECVGGAKGIDEEGLGINYETYCDPRLNYEQSLEMAFMVARQWKESFAELLDNYNYHR